MKQKGRHGGEDWYQRREAGWGGVATNDQSETTGRVNTGGRVGAGEVGRSSKTRIQDSRGG